MQWWGPFKGSLDDHLWSLNESHCRNNKVMIGRAHPLSLSASSTWPLGVVSPGQAPQVWASLAQVAPSSVAE